MLHPPTIVNVSDSAVTVSITPPADTNAFKVIKKYAIKYRKVGDNAWKSTRKSINLSQIVTGLDASTLYEFKVAAKYQGGRSTAESTYVQAKTSEATCMLYCSFAILNQSEVILDGKTVIFI